MRTINASIFSTVDGIGENPAWSFEYWSDEQNDWAGHQLDGVEALLLGRVTYQGMAEAWPKSPDPGAAVMNDIGKYVVTNTLTEPTWNATFLTGDTVTAVRELKESGDGSLLVYGSLDLVNTLLTAGLLDEIRLVTAPLVLGTGKRIFADGTAAKLEHTDSTNLPNGVVVHTYRPVR
jgi:dihydrofolate reductase